MPAIIKKGVKYGGGKATSGNDTTIRYNDETDMIQIKINDDWIDVIRAYAQSKNWIPNVYTDLTNIFGNITFLKGTNGTNNEATYRTDKFVLIGYNGTTSAGNSSMWTSEKVPLNMFSSVTVKFKQQNAVSDYPLQVRMDTTHAFSSGNQIILYTCETLGDSGELEITLDLSAYNNSAVERYFGITILGNAYIYDITFNK